VGGQLRLLGYDVENLSTALAPGQALRFTLYWEAQAKMDRNWSVFAHVLDSDLELPLAIRDRYPGQGLLATSIMEPGLRWTDRYVIWLDETTYAPSRAGLEVGLYDAESGERPPIRIEQGDALVVENALRFQSLQVEPHPGDIPNPLLFSFEDKIALIGWDVDRRMIPAGEALQLTLYWECLAPMQYDYQISAQVVRADRRKAAQSDMAPGGVPTSDWVEGQRIIDLRELPIDPGAPPGGYEIVVSAYGWESPDAIKRLRIVDSQGYVLPGDSLTLGQVRVTP
jgi:hypothetical protein